MVRFDNFLFGFLVACMTNLPTDGAAALNPVYSVFDLEKECWHLYFNIPVISQTLKKNVMKFYSAIIFSMYSWKYNYNNESGSFIITMLLCLYIASLKTNRLIPHEKHLGLSDSSLQ